MIGPADNPQESDCCRHAPRIQIRRVAGLAFNFSAAPAAPGHPSPPESSQMDLLRSLSRIAFPSLQPSFLNLSDCCDAR